MFYVELGHSWKVITHATREVIHLKLIGMFFACENCALGNAKKTESRKVSKERSKIKGDTLFSSSFSHSKKIMWRKKLAAGSRRQCHTCLELFLKEKSEFKGVMAQSIKI